MTIDWTRPLRTTGPEHHPVQVVGIEPDRPLPIHILVIGTGGRFVLTRDGRMAAAAKAYVENVPPTLTVVVERWTVVDHPATDTYTTIGASLWDGRQHAVRERDGYSSADRLRIARVLIEEEVT